MRVIAGSKKGRRLKSPKGISLRPTSDRVKEVIFSHLGERIKDSIVLDLFAGTGNLGIEALSRGARTATFVDHSKRALQVVRRNLEVVDFKEKAEILLSDAFRYLRKSAPLPKRYDLIFADPPYDDHCPTKVVENVSNTHLLKKGGELILEHSKRESLPKECGELVLEKHKIIGDTAISIYQNREKE